MNFRRQVLADQGRVIVRRLGGHVLDDPSSSLLGANVNKATRNNDRGEDEKEGGGELHTLIEPYTVIVQMN